MHTEGIEVSFDQIVISFIQIFAILDPIALIPIFSVLTKDYTPHERKKIAIGATAIALGLGVGVIFIGDLVLAYIGVSLGSFRLAGGILLLISAIDMFSGLPRGKKISDIDDSEIPPEKPFELASVPLATPLLLGPGTITLLVTLSHQIDLVSLLIASTSAIIISGLILMSSNWVEKLLSDSGVKLLSRLMALIVASVAVEFIHLTLVEWKLAQI